MVLGNANAAEICTHCSVISFVKLDRRAYKAHTFSVAMLIIRRYEASFPFWENLRTSRSCFPLHPVTYIV
jgi:hypothetical protein